VSLFTGLLACMLALGVFAALRLRGPLYNLVVVAARLVWTSWVFVRLGLRLLVQRLAGQTANMPVLLRDAFEELGPTWVKLAQLLASSHGLVPERYRRELERTLDRVRPLPFFLIATVIEEELGPIPARFTSIEPLELAAASIAQVHRAVLSDGRVVALKVQRPGIHARVHADLMILMVLARVAERLPLFRLANPRAVVDDLARTLGDELDFLREADHLDEFNRWVTELGHDDVRAPRVIREVSTRRVLAMEFFDGVRIDDVRAVAQRGFDGEERLVSGMRAWFRVLLLRGFFHGDVHAGNLLILADGSIGFLDFGIIGRLDLPTRRHLAELLASALTGNFTGLASTLVALDAVSGPKPNQPGTPPNPPNLTTDLATDLAALVEPLRRQGLADIRLAELLPEILRVAARHKLRLPRALVLVAKQLLYFDRYGKLLAPGLNVFADPRLVGSLLPDLLAVKTHPDIP